jgi:hypothetical protein
MISAIIFVIAVILEIIIVLETLYFIFNCFEFTPLILVISMALTETLMYGVVYITG